ncbi:TIGR03086 family metal-binding protein [Streptomonospora wellingtoniae]|uniref:TIGR03086 family metal-binding protein n=1 Tax=Streptomonospora wellingtoniae TaxID=3075544 RepID=A0ABU2KNB2_9ACTN|nr:TIGR03086 family metal-binding protein [Streptomonospora sp. DSM 45055]MDT0300760.1 TIGR03086 family metal-binding protein [Streptomonospora sp. DSM 45055]
MDNANTATNADTPKPDTVQIAERYRELSAEFSRRVEGVPEGRWASPTPCPGWTARDLLRHMIDNHTNMPSYVGVAIELRTSVEDDPVAAWHEARSALQEVLDDPEQAAKEFDGYFGRISLARTVDDFLGFDLVVHAWDLARATGQDETLPAAEVTRVFEGARRLGDTLRMEGVCGPEVSVPESASEQDRMLAYLGRRP